MQPHGFGRQTRSNRTLPVKTCLELECAGLRSDLWNASNIRASRRKADRQHVFRVEVTMSSNMLAILAPNAYDPFEDEASRRKAVLRL